MTTIAIRPLEPDDGPRLQLLYDRQPQLEDIFETVGPADAQSTYLTMPPGRSIDDKYLVGVWLASQLIGAADVIFSHPTPEDATCGLLLVGIDHRGRGVGSELLGHIEDEVRRRGARTLTMLVQPRNPMGGDFLVKRGYVCLASGTGRAVRYIRRVSD